MPHCERRAAVMAPPGTAMYFYMDEGSWGFTILYDLQFSSDTQMWKEEIARCDASCCLGSSTSPRRSRGHALSSVLRRTDDKAIDLRITNTTLQFRDSMTDRLSERDALSRDSAGEPHAGDLLEQPGCPTSRRVTLKG